MKKRSRRPGKTAALTIPPCSHFTGYKPCVPETLCLEQCVDPKPIGKRILIVNLEAMGNVLLTTSILPAVKRKYPASTISWITLINAYHLLDNNPLVDRVYVWEPESWLKLQALEFDVVMCFDKSVAAGALVNSLRAKTKLGYAVNKNGVIIPLNKAAEYDYRLGLDDQLKFHTNQKPNTQLLCEAMGFSYARDEYILNLTEEELAFCRRYKRQLGLDDDSLTVGFNTGCSVLYPNKKMTIAQHVVLVDALANQVGIRVVLLGGPEDTDRNAEIERQVGDNVISTPTTEGLRRGICYENVCDVVVSGDSFGMHVAIGLKKYVIVWFGVSCQQEIDLFDRGVKLIPTGLACSPCWKRVCPYDLECLQMIDMERLVAEVISYRDKHPAAAVSGH